MLKTQVPGAAALMLVLMSGTAFAQAPAVLPVQGFVTDNEGAPLNGPWSMTFALYTEATGGNSLFEEAQSVMVAEGYFTAYLGTDTEIDLALFRNGGEVFVEVRIDGDTLAPRLRMGTVPYAAYAEYAANADTAGTAQSAATADSVDFAGVQNVPADLADGDDDTTYSAGTGINIAADNSINTALSGSGGVDVSGAVVSADPAVLQRRVNGACAPNQAIRAVGEDGTVSCVDVPRSGSDFNVAGDGTWSINPGRVQTRVTGACPPGQAIRAVSSNGAVSCASIPAGDITGVLTGSSSGLRGGCTSGVCDLAVDPTVFNGGNPIGFSTGAAVATPAGSTDVVTLATVAITPGTVSGEVLLIGRAETECYLCASGQTAGCGMGWSTSSTGRPRLITGTTPGFSSITGRWETMTAIDNYGVAGNPAIVTYYLRGFSGSSSRRCLFNEIQAGAVFVPR